MTFSILPLQLRISKEVKEEAEKGEEEKGKEEKEEKGEEDEKSHIVEYLKQSHDQNMIT